MPSLLDCALFSPSVSGYCHFMLYIVTIHFQPRGLSFSRQTAQTHGSDGQACIMGAASARANEVGRKKNRNRQADKAQAIYPKSVLRKHAYNPVHQ